MKNNLKTALIALIFGMLGAYIFNSLQGVALWNPYPPASYHPISEASGKVVKENPQRFLENEADFVKASALSTPSVVYIKTVSDSKYNEFSLWDFYFGDGPRGRKAIGSGSGVIFTSDGYIVTNYHVIEDAEKIEVIHQKKTYEASIIGTDPSADLAIVKIDAKNLPAIKKGSSKRLAVGEWVIAVGNPFNLESTVTAGIVSAKGRDIDLLGGQFPLESFIQTDAAINPGNSGGALVNMEGELVGINTAIISRTGSYTGYGFAVPVDIVAKIFNDILQYGEVQKSFTGLEVSDINTEIARQYDLQLDNFEGALITNVQNGSAASEQGLRKGDVIVKINNDPVTTKSSLEELLSYYRPGDQINLTYRRGKQLKEVQITLTNREGTTDILENEVFSAEKLGVDLEPISKIEKDKLGIDHGVRVVKVKRGFFSRLPIEEGFIITSINRQKITRPEQVEEILANIGGKVYIEGINKNGVRGYYSLYF